MATQRFSPLLLTSNVDLTCGREAIYAHTQLGTVVGNRAANANCQKQLSPLSQRIPLLTVSVTAKGVSTRTLFPARVLRSPQLSLSQT